MPNEIHNLAENITAESTDSSYIYTGKLPGAGYHRSVYAMHTAMYIVDTFIGAIKLQATLAVDPAEVDWFDVDNTQIGLGSDSSSWTTATAVNFTGNFVWIRAAYNLQNGTITVIRFTY